MSFSKVHLLKVKDGHGLTITFKETDSRGAGVDGNRNHRGLIHSDLKNAIDALGVHLACIVGWVKPSEVEDIAMPDAAVFSKFHIHGYSIGGDEDKPNIVISGHMMTYRNKAHNFHTPVELMDGNPESMYGFMDDLKAKILVIEQEVEAYLAGKRGEASKAPKEPVDERQGDLFDAEKGKNKRSTSTKVKVLPDTTTPLNDGSGKTAKIPQADKDAMARVAAESNEELNGTPKESKSASKRRQRQTPDNPGGD